LALLNEKVFKDGVLPRILELANLMLDRVLSA